MKYKILQAEVSKQPFTVFPNMKIVVRITSRINYYRALLTYFGGRIQNQESGASTFGWCNHIDDNISRLLTASFVPHLSGNTVL